MQLEEIKIGNPVIIREFAYGFKGFKGIVVDETGVLCWVKFEGDACPHAFDKKEVIKL